MFSVVPSAVTVNGAPLNPAYREEEFRFYLDDTDGGFMTFGTKAQSLTVTSDHLIAGSLKARLEYRTDFADDAIFPDEDGGSKDSQTTFTVGLVVTFGGKI